MTPELVEPFLDGMTLEEALKKKKIYIVNLKKLSDVMCRFNRVVSKITGIFIIMENDLPVVALSKMFETLDIFWFETQGTANPFLTEIRHYHLYFVVPENTRTPLMEVFWNGPSLPTGNGSFLLSF